MNDRKKEDDHRGQATPRPDDNTIQEEGNSTEAPSVERRYRDIGPFKIVEKIGEGGMGSVFLAEQIRPIKRQVALKVIKSQSNSKKVVARFEAERQALAIMDHPNIAKILDAGTTEDGLPYFAMELVDGVPIQQYCDQHRLSINDRLGIFIPICQAVQHAHQKGIIHRDLKPSNVLVDHNDGKPIPKVIDFGLAKAIDQQNLLTEHSQHTDFGKIVGTIQYMSPEQAETGNANLDTRTDVYSLGVILYELLTGSIPLDAETLGENALVKVLEIIRDQDPPRPSLRLAESSDTISAVSEDRRLAPRQLENILKGDLDWIVMKAIEKERDRRYESASSFAADIDRFLKSEVVYARPPSTAYRLRKFVGRNRLVVATSMIGSLLMAGGAIGTVWFAYQSNLAASSEKKQKEVAIEKSEEAERQRTIAEKAKVQAQNAADRSAAVLKIVTDSFGSSDPNRGARANMTATDVLKNAQDLMSTSNLDGQGKGKLLTTITESFIGIGAVDLAISSGTESVRINRESFGEDSSLALRALNNLAAAHQDAGKLKIAEELFAECLEKRRAQLGGEHEDTLATRNNLANVFYAQGRNDEAYREFKELLSVREAVLGKEHPDTYYSRNNLAIVMQSLGKYDEAAEMLEKVVEFRRAELGRDHPMTISAVANLGNVFLRLRDYAKATKIYNDVLEDSKKKLGKEHPTTIGIMINLANSYRALRKLSEAMAVIEEAYAASLSKFGDDHPYTLGALQNLAVVSSALGKSKLSISYYEKLKIALENKYGRGNIRTLVSINNLAIKYRETGRHNESLEMLQEIVPIAVEVVGGDNPMVLKLRAKLAEASIQNGDNETALQELEKVQSIRKDRLGLKHPDYLEGQLNLAAANQDDSNVQQALEISKNAYDVLLTTRWGSSHKLRLAFEHQLAGLYELTQEFDQSEAFYKKVIKDRTKMFGAGHQATLESQLNFSKFQLNRLQFQQAKDNLQKYLSESEKSGMDSWQRSYAKTLLGDALFGLKDFAQSQQQLVDGYVGMKARLQAIPPSVRQRIIPVALSRLIMVADAIDDEKQKAKWELELQLFEESKNEK